MHIKRGLRNPPPFDSAIDSGRLQRHIPSKSFQSAYCKDMRVILRSSFHQ